MSDCNIDIQIKKLELIIKYKMKTLLLPIIVDNKDLEKYIIERLVNINSDIVVCDAFSSDNFLEEVNNLLKREFSCITNLPLYFRNFDAEYEKRFYLGIEFTRDSIFLNYRTMMILFLESSNFKSFVKYANNFYSYSFKGFDFSCYDDSSISDYLKGKVYKR